MPKARSGLSLFWRFQLVGWLAFLIFSFPVKVAILGSVGPAVWLGVFREILAFILTLAMRVFYKRVYRHPMEVGRIAIIIGGVSMLGGMLLSILNIALEDCLGIAAGSHVLSLSTFTLFYFSTSVFIAWSVLYFGIRLLRDSSVREIRLAQAESRQREAELQMLRAQMNPHFLFNAFNTLQAGAGISGEEGRALVRALAEYLRYSLAHGNDNLVPLGKEFDALASFLTIEKARFREKLEIDCRIEESARSAAVPGVLLQPLVENAIKYGSETSPLPLRVGIYVSGPDDGMVQIEVRNTGHWIEPDDNENTGGIGLHNLRQRLALLYPGRHELKVSAGDGWVTVCARIPVAAQEAVK